VKTTKPLSTISYNTFNFLLGVLDRLVSNDILSFYAFIHHDAEEDENKDHFHVYMEMAKAVDTIWLRKQFNEPDPNNPKDPLGVLPFNKSKFCDWYWYGLHDKSYLLSKGQSRKFHYEATEVITDDTEYLAELVRQNPRPTAELAQVTELLQHGFTPMQIALQMNVKLRNLPFFLHGLEEVKGHVAEITNRGASVPHLEAWNATQAILNSPDGVIEITEKKDEN